MHHGWVGTLCGRSRAVAHRRALVARMGHVLSGGSGPIHPALCSGPHQEGEVMNPSVARWARWAGNSRRTGVPRLLSVRLLGKYGLSEHPSRERHCGVARHLLAVPSLGRARREAGDGLARLGGQPLMPLVLAVRSPAQARPGSSSGHASAHQLSRGVMRPARPHSGTWGRPVDWTGRLISLRRSVVQASVYRMPEYR